MLHHKAKAVKAAPTEAQRALALVEQRGHTIRTLGLQLGKVDQDAIVQRLTHNH